VKYVDADGNAVETAVDVVCVGFSAYDFIKDPSWKNAGLALLDIGCAAAPFVPAVGLARHSAKIAKVFNKADDVADVTKAVDKASDAEKAGIYEFEATSGKTYVGQSKDVPNRLKQHARDGKITQENVEKAKITPVEGNKTTREIAEQKRIKELGGKENLENKRNAIGKDREHLLKE